MLLVGPGRVDDLAADLLPAAGTPAAIVALGGGRVIDVAKAIAAAIGPDCVVAAVPTTLSAAEMTWVHRHARGVDPATPRVRPRIVLNDPGAERLAADARPRRQRRERPRVTRSTERSPRSPRRSRPWRPGTPHGAWRSRCRPSGEPDRDGLALGALLSGYAIDANWYGLHHVMSQTLVREAGAGHGPANAAMLPVTSAALRERLPDAVAAIDAVVGEPVEAVARRFAERAGALRLRDIGVPEELLAVCAQAASERSELALTPPPPGPRELEELYRAAW